MQTFIKVVDDVLVGVHRGSKALDGYERYEGDDLTLDYPLQGVEMRDGKMTLKDNWQDFIVPEPAPPAPPEPAPVFEITVPAFKLRLTPQERIALRQMIATDPLIEDLFDLINDPRTTVIDVSDPSVIAGISYAIDQLVLAGVVTAEDSANRLAAITDKA